MKDLYTVKLLKIRGKAHSVSSWLSSNSAVNWNSELHLKICFQNTSICFET